MGSFGSLSTQVLLALRAHVLFNACFQYRAALFRRITPEARRKIWPAAAGGSDNGGQIQKIHVFPLSE